MYRHISQVHRVHIECDVRLSLCADIEGDGDGYGDGDGNQSDGQSINQKQIASFVREFRDPRACNMVHVPYKRAKAPFHFMRLVRCQSCKRKWVPDTLLTTIEPAPGLEIRGKGQLLEARVCRMRVSEGDTHSTAQWLLRNRKDEWLLGCTRCFCYRTLFSRKFTQQCSFREYPQPIAVT